MAHERIQGSSRTTRQRAAVAQAVLAAANHPSADQVYDDVRRHLPSISLGTVYRVLGSLAESGEIRVLAPSVGPRRYDRTLEPHAHIVCDRCGSVADVPVASDPHARDMVEAATGYRVTDCDVQWTGLCPACCRVSRAK